MVIRRPTGFLAGLLTVLIMTPELPAGGTRLSSSPVDVSSSGAAVDLGSSSRPVDEPLQCCFLSNSSEGLPRTVEGEAGDGVLAIGSIVSLVFHMGGTRTGVQTLFVRSTGPWHPENERIGGRWELLTAALGVWQPGQAGADGGALPAAAST